MKRERISIDEAQKLERRARHKEIVTTLTRLDNSAIQNQMLDLMSKITDRLMAMQATINELKVKTGEPITVQPQITVDTAILAESFEKGIAVMEARLQHELARLQAKEQTGTMHIEFTRNDFGYIQSPIIVKPA